MLKVVFWGGGGMLNYAAYSWFFLSFLGSKACLPRMRCSWTTRQYPATSPSPSSRRGTGNISFVPLISLYIDTTIVQLLASVAQRSLYRAGQKSGP